jgi:hypothetical protein
VFETGRNWQNLEKSKRKIVEAPDGYVILNRDQAGADARVVAFEAPDGNFRQLFINKIKPHAFVALRRYNNEFCKRFPDKAESFKLAAQTEIKDLAKLPCWKELAAIIADSDNWENGCRYYFNAKTQVHSLNYLCGAFVYRDTILKRSGGTLFIPYEEATYDIKIYQETLFPEIFSIWHPRVLKQFLTTKTLYNLFGSPRRFTNLQTFYDYKTKKADKDIYAFVPQSTVGELTHIAATRLQRYIQQARRPWHLFNNSHDSYAVFIPESDRAEAIAKTGEFMNMELTSTTGETFVMESGCQIGKNFAPYHPKKNPFGLQEVK